MFKIHESRTHNEHALASYRNLLMCLFDHPSVHPTDRVDQHFPRSVCACDPRETPGFYGATYGECHKGVD